MSKLTTEDLNRVTAELRAAPPSDWAGKDVEAELHAMRYGDDESQPKTEAQMVLDIMKFLERGLDGYTMRVIVEGGVYYAEAWYHPDNYMANRVSGNSFQSLHAAMVEAGMIGGE